MIRFTIITCTYNAADVLQRTLDSVLQQTYPAVEHLIVDGASADDTVAMAMRYKEKSDATAGGHVVVVASERDGGLYDAMNKGIDRATGDYLIFLNAGDKLHAADTLERMAAGVADGEELPAVLYADTDIVDNEGRFVRHRRLAPPPVLTWRSFRNGMLVCHQAFYARRDVAQKTHYNLDYRLSADFDWCIRVMKEADQMGLKMQNVKLIAVDYLEGGMSVQNHRASLKERFRIMCRHYGTLQTLAMHAWFVVRQMVKK